MNSFTMQIPFKNKTLKVLAHGKHNFVIFIDNKAKMSIRKLKGSWKIICSDRGRKRMVEITESISVKPVAKTNYWQSVSTLNEELIVSILTKEYENHRIEKVIFG